MVVAISLQWESNRSSLVMVGLGSEADIQITRPNVRFRPTPDLHQSLMNPVRADHNGVGKRAFGKLCGFLTAMQLVADERQTEQQQTQ
jgi:hypothetical protein